MSDESSKLSRRYLSTKARVRRAERAIQKNIRLKARMLPQLKSSKDFKQILKHFIIPLVNSSSSNGSIKQKLEELFGTNYRQIMTFVSKTAFKIEGSIPIWQENHETASRHIKIGDILLVRTDIRAPNTVDIESIKNNIMYRLTAIQYADILKKIERLTPCQMNEADILQEPDNSTD